MAGGRDLEISGTADVHMLPYCIAQGNDVRLGSGLDNATIGSPETRR